MNNLNIWLILFLIFATLNVFFVMWVMNFLSHPKFREEIGDLTTEVGYEEDPIGHIRKGYRFPSQDELEDPHMAIERFTQ